MSFYGNIDGSKTRIGFIKLWQTYIIKKLKKNQSMYPKLRGYNFYSNGNATMSGKSKINFYYTIDGYPAEVPMSFKKDIRREARQGVRVSFISTFEPTRIDWRSPQMRSKIKTWKSIDSNAEAVDEYNYIDNISSMDSTERRKASLVYLADADQRRKRQLFRYRTMLIVSGVRGENFDKSIFEIEEYCARKGIIITRVEEQLPDFLRAFSPFSAELNNGVMKLVGSNTIPDEQIARFSNYDQGKIGKGGVLMGTDIYSGFSVYKRFKKKDTDAENILITAETGGGKSVLLKFIIIQLLGDPVVSGTINDIEGFEYIPLGGFVGLHSDVVVLNMAEGQGCYYDPVEIVMTGNEDLDRDMFSYATSFTNSLFCVLLGEKLLDESVWAQKIVDNAIARAYSDMGVVEDDMSTWSNSKGKDLFYVYNKFKELYQEYFDVAERYKRGESLELYQRYKLNEGYLDALDKVVASLSEYFEPLSRGGIRSNVFKRKVSLSDIADAKLVINSFGMAGKSAETVNKTQMALTQLSAANISYIRSVFSKARGVYNFKVWEEFQRWGSFKGSVGTIKQAITGGRKLGDINFIVTNAIKELLDDDRFAIFDNVTSFAVGAIASATTRERICKELSVPLLQHDLDLLVTSKGDASSYESERDETSMYDKAFLLKLDDSVSTISKVMLPKHIMESNLFKTGVNLKG